MTTVYKWDSTRKTHEVIESILSMTDRKKRTHPLTCTYKQFNSSEIKFTLWYNPFWNRKPSYDPPSLKGTIHDTVNGCVISAEAKRIMAYIGNVTSIGLILLLYITGFAALLADFHLWFIPSILFFLLAIGSTWLFVHTYKKYNNLKVHLETMNTAAGVDYRVISF